MKHPYSTTHYHCGCHIVEDEPKNRDLEKSIFCCDEPKLKRYIRCLYTPVLKMLRKQASRRVC